MNRCRFCQFACALVVTGICSAALAAETQLTTTRIASGLASPVGVVAPPGESGRLFVVQQGGQIRIIKNGQVLATPFISISVTFSGEQGLLGLAFDPDYQSNGYFYVNYVRSGVTRVSRFSVSDTDADVADPSSELLILSQSQPFSNHNAGQLAFSPNDGMLYIGFGDGGSGNDPGNRAQNPQIWLGKMLRIDVRNAQQGDPYDIPADNPFIDDNGVLDEIWSLGLRNPWRYSFDVENSDLYIADVGQNAREEVDYRPGDSMGGENYGWRCLEGFRCTGLSGCSCTDQTLTAPIHEYTHSLGCSITGGYVYRGLKMPDLSGTYFFADWCSARIWSLRVVNGEATDIRDRTAELDPPNFAINNIASFGQDNNGEVYIVDRGGEVFKILPRGLATATAFEVTRGVLGSGDLGSLGESDDQDVVVQARRPTEIAASSAEIEVTGTVGNENPAELRFAFEGSTSGQPTEQLIQMFNYDTGRWELMDQRQAPSSDESVLISVEKDPARFIEDGTGEVKARIGYRDLGVTFPAWSGNFDQVCWVAVD
jgi:glucose/arabinose dehydrogenase